MRIHNAIIMSYIFMETKEDFPTVYLKIICRYSDSTRMISLEVFFLTIIKNEACTKTGVILRQFLERV